ncbi:BirA family transcriptional regulator, biotin operon repressor / biotin-[acetyl-CoA-carboxylase] ligase [Ectothiorhodospira mobilis]|uniref:biotin--[biotin carboxyl-carrier protein] ligase n=1 Tax=Ectothiorhodospira mobilis TaxID=195064 RepID=A0A1I4PBU5_ECTMO|nr:biotin--[acetyl-CoA-carboxylase] ligase [Ectothiorhodospira mobilis]SFM25242.1 BirA family transcriptional regulator, biotin operon repressor / biotin-[acetyl-CoA-carboxylase] ligase [Ectothiorhodospira mobilis]
MSTSDPAPRFPDGLLRLLAEAQPRTPRELAVRLGIPVPEVEAGLQGLRQAGLDWRGQAGYILPPEPPPDPVDADAVGAALKDLPQVPQVHALEQVDSTSAWLDRARRQGMRGPVACCTDFQSAGRGRRGRQWRMPPCAGMALSLLWDIRHWPRPDASVTLAAGVALARALEDLGVRGLQLKWPNDLYLDGRKLGGILVEVRAGRDGPDALILGVGINLRLPAHMEVGQPHADLAGAGLDPLPSRSLLAATLIRALEGMLQSYPEPGFAAFLGEWNRRDATRDRPVALSGGDGCTGIARGVDEGGRLCLETDRGLLHIETGEIGLRSRP